MAALFAPAPRITPVVPVPSLVTSARLMPTETTDVRGNPVPLDWRSGISFRSVMQPSFTWPDCIDPLLFAPVASPGLRKTLPAASRIVNVNPFVIYTPQSCEMPVDGDDLVALINELMQAHLPSALAGCLWMGTGLSADETDNPTLRRSALDVTPGGAAMDLDDGVAVLLAFYEQHTGGNGGAVIHAPSSLMPALLGGGGGGARICWPEGNVYRAANGAVVSPGPGYPLGSSPAGANGFGPLTAPGPPELYSGNSDHESWIYCTGPVEYAVNDVRILPDADQRIAFRQNNYEVWGERDAIIRFDPGSTFACKVANPATLGLVS